MKVFIVTHFYPLQDKMRRPTVCANEAAVRSNFGDHAWERISPTEWLTFSPYRDCDGPHSIVYHIEEVTVVV